MKAEFDNLFVGAVLTKDNDKYLVVKVNAKSFYAAKNTTMEDYSFAFGAKAKNVTFKQFCDSNGIKMYHYNDGFDISEEEAKKKQVVEMAKNTTSLLDKADKATLTELIKKKKLKPLANIAVGNKIFRVIENRDNDKLLLNLDNNYVLYNRSLDISYKVCSVYDWGRLVTAVPWEKISPQ